jgi:hypothetical protein
MTVEGDAVLLAPFGSRIGLERLGFTALESVLLDVFAAELPVADCWVC